MVVEPDLNKGEMGEAEVDVLYSLEVEGIGGRLEERNEYPRLNLTGTT